MAMRYESPHKRYVYVLDEHRVGGGIFPLSLTDEEGESAQIDRILDIRQAASLKAGGNGVRYICRVEGREIRLFHDRDDWFIEV